MKQGTCGGAVGARVLLFGVALACVFGCQRPAPAVVVAPGNTFAEMRTIKGAIAIAPAGEQARAPYPRERLAEGDVVTVPAGGLAWIRRDAGAVWLVEGAAKLTVHAGAMDLAQGRAFVDTEDGPPALVDGPRGRVELADARASVDVLADGGVDVYVLRGSARTEGAERVGAGELLSLRAGRTTRAAVLAWDDWTGGLATADARAEPAPFGIGTVGARPPGDRGKPRFPLVVQRLDVRVRIDRDFAVTEVDETFVNPSAETVEGIYSFRTPPGAVLQRFGVDRSGDLVWGRIKESAAAKAQYESHVYQGSTEDPALLQWQAPGVYSARLYPIARGAQRRVVTRYTEWLPRQGRLGERRLYVYPMAAEGARASLPRIEELTVTLDLARAGAQRVRAGMGGKRQGEQVVIQAFDFVPKADLAVELFDAGQPYAVAYRAPHALGPEEAPVAADPEYARDVSRAEPDYLLVPLRAPPAADAPPGVDLAIVVDTSAATEAGALAVARNLASALLAHLGPEDRAALWAGDATLRPVAQGSGELSPVDPDKRRTWLAGLAAVDVGGATDIGALLTEAAGSLDPKRTGVVVYIGDGQPSVGEMAPKALRERLARLRPGTRVLVAGVGSHANLALLQSVARGAPAEAVGDAYDAARAALRLLEAAERPAWLGATVDLGADVDRVLPLDVPPVGVEGGVLVVGRVSGRGPSSMTLTGSGGSATRPLRVVPLVDAGDLRRRWGEYRMAQLLQEGAGRAALVDIGRRYGVVSPVTSLYVPTSREQRAEGEPSASLADLQASARERRVRWKPWRNESRREYAAVSADAASAMKEGGTGTRAKGEEGSMGNPNTKDTPRAYALESPSDDREARLDEASQLGTIGLAGASVAANAPPPVAEAMRAAPALAAPAAPAAKVMRGDPLSADAKGGRAANGIAAGSLSVVRDAEVSAKKPSAEKATALADVGHTPRPCGPGADLPFDDRRVLWRERLGEGASPQAALDVYRRALSDCEATTWRERYVLLLAMVDSVRTVRSRVELWRRLLASPAAQEVVYRAIVVRVQTPAELRELHDALGLRSVDPDLLAKRLATAKTPDARLTVLRGAAKQWPDDFELALRTLDAYEDAGDDAGGRAWARRLRSRPDATAHVYTDVGEYYLRRARGEQGAAGERDTTEARRTFGELVEFAPDDPVARRRLGDLLRAHAWYEEAFRQYETLAVLTPDDPAVPLLLASAAQGMGRIEEAVGWAEKAAAAGSPDGSSPLSQAARATASAFLAWAREDAVRAGKQDDADKLRARARRLAGPSAAQQGSVRFLVTWSHPELHPALWTSALGAMMPAPDNFPVFGVAEAWVPASPSAALELRMDPEDAARAARLGVSAVVTALAEEGAPSEHVDRLEVAFRGSGVAVLDRVRVVYEGGSLRTEAE